MRENNLFNKNFILIIIGQIVSLFGNGIIRFILPLYLLDLTGSAMIFGFISALSFIPLILVMPVGGLIADKLNKRNIIVILDFLTGILMLVFLILLNKVNIILLFLITMMILYAINGLYQPTIQSIVSVVLDKKLLIKGNSIISSISSLSNFLSPIIAGILFSKYNINTIIFISIICFILSAISEIFINIDFNKNLEKTNIFNILKEDFSISISFIFKQNKIIRKIIFVSCILNCFISSLVVIGLPIIINNRLNFSSNFYGLATGILAFGGIFGGVISGILNIKIQHLYKIFFLLTISIIPFLFSIFFIKYKVLSYSFILVSVFFIMMLATVISIIVMTYIQSNTPQNILGKVMSFLLVFSICFQPIGQAFYGFVFEYFVGYEYLIILLPILISLFMSFYVKFISKI